MKSAVPGYPSANISIACDAHLVMEAFEEAKALAKVTGALPPK
jgi:hypothetical protein